jgi:hypothetical protein
MAAFIHNTGRIQRMLGCSLMVVHHSGKDALKGLRGHSSLLGAVDTQLELAKIDATPNPASDVAGSAILTVSKQKDGRDDLTPWGFKLQDVLIGIDEDGDEINSPVVIETNTLVTPKSEKTKKGEEDVWTRNVLDYIATLEPHIGGMELPTLIDNVLDFMPGDTAARLPGLRAHMGDVVQAMTKGKNRSIHVANGYATFLV